LFDAASGGGSSRSDLWRYTSPYRGLAAMEEKDSDYFFGRKRETVDVLSALADAPDRLPLLIGNSGVGKSSLAQAGVLAALKRQAWPEEASQTPNGWPAAFHDSRQWCFLSLKPGTDPLKARDRLTRARRADTRERACASTRSLALLPCASKSQGFGSGFLGHWLGPSPA
jgi:hypothetical protein